MLSIRSVSQWQEGRVPLTATNLPKIGKRGIWKRGEKSRKGGKKSGRKDKNWEGSFTLPFLTERAGYTLLVMLIADGLNTMQIACHMKSTPYLRIWLLSKVCTARIPLPRCPFRMTSDLLLDKLQSRTSPAAHLNKFIKYNNVVKFIINLCMYTRHPSILLNFIKLHLIQGSAGPPDGGDSFKLYILVKVRSKALLACFFLVVEIYHKYLFSLPFKNVK